MPRVRLAAPAPVLVFFYGGGWTSGSKETYRFVGAALAARGVLVVIPDYRLYPAVRFPAFMNDAAAAVGWAHANAARFGGDAHRLFLMGHSAGGQIAVLLALDPGYLQSVDLASGRDICGVIGLAAPYDFQTVEGADMTGIFGPEKEWQRAQPIEPRIGNGPINAAVGGPRGSNHRSSQHAATRRTTARRRRQRSR